MRPISHGHAAEEPHFFLPCLTPYKALSAQRTISTTSSKHTSDSRTQTDTSRLYLYFSRTQCGTACPAYHEPVSGKPSAFLHPRRMKTGPWQALRRTVVRQNDRHRVSSPVQLMFRDYLNELFSSAGKVIPQTGLSSHGIAKHSHTLRISRISENAIG